MNSLLKTSHLTVAINNKIICKDLALSISPGERWGVLGPNGCGKTTLIHTLAGLYPAKSGHVDLYHKPLQHYSRKEIAKNIGVLFQDTTFTFPQTVFEFCMSGRHPHSSSARENESIVNTILSQMELSHLSSQTIQTLSGGEKRRLAIATVLAQTPRFLFLDEPTNHLDLRYQLHVLNHIKSISEKYATGTMMVMHDLNLARQYCDHVLMIFPNGKTLQGLTRDMLTQENISKLYQVELTDIEELSGLT